MLPKVLIRGAPGAGRGHKTNVSLPHGKLTRLLTAVISSYFTIVFTVSFIVFTM